MLYAVTIEPLNTTFFVSERPEDNEWEVQEGVALEIPFNYGTWTSWRRATRTNPLRFDLGSKYYKLFKNRRDIDPAAISAHGSPFWRALFQVHPGSDSRSNLRPRSRSICTEVDEPPGATEEAVASSSEEVDLWPGSSSWIRARWAMRAESEVSLDVERLTSWLHPSEWRMARSSPFRRLPTTRSGVGFSGRSSATAYERLDLLANELGFYIPISTAAMRRAAELWADARRKGMRDLRREKDRCRCHPGGPGDRFCRSQRHAWLWRRITQGISLDMSTLSHWDDIRA